MEILIIDQPLWNRGDESAHKGLIRNLIHAVPDIHITVMEIDVSPLAINEFDMNLPQVRYINLKPRNAVWFSRIVRHAYKYHLGWLLSLSPTGNAIRKLYKHADYIMMAPGGINLGGFQDWRHLSLMLLAHDMKKPLIYYGRSIGPFLDTTWTQRRFLQLAKKTLDSCRFVCLRDEKSVQTAQGLGIECVPTTDSAFLDSTSVEIPDSIKQVIGDKKYIVFVPNELIWHYTFRNCVPVSTINAFYIRIVQILQKYYPDHKILMLPQTNNQRRNDYPYFCELKQSYPNNEDIVVLPDTYSSDIQQAVIRQAELMVGARYHSIVFAINQSIPFVSLSYEHKMAGLLEKLGETDCLIDITNAFANEKFTENALSHFQTIISNLQKNKTTKREAKRIAQNCFDLFVKSLQSH